MLIQSSEDFVRYFSLQRRKPRQFRRIRVTLRPVIRVLEIAVSPLVRVVIEGFIHPVEIKRQRNSFTHPSVTELRALKIEGQPAGVLGSLILLILFDDIIIT